MEQSHLTFKETCLEGCVQGRDILRYPEMSQIMKGCKTWGHMGISWDVSGHEGTYGTWDLKDVCRKGMSWDILGCP